MARSRVGEMVVEHPVDFPGSKEPRFSDTYFFLHCNQKKKGLAYHALLGVQIDHSLGLIRQHKLHVDYYRLIHDTTLDSDRVESDLIGTSDPLLGRKNQNQQLRHDNRNEGAEPHLPKQILRNQRVEHSHRIS